MPRRPAWAGDLRAIFLVVAVLHVAVVLAVGHFRRPALYENGAIARNLVEGRGFSGPLLPPPEHHAVGSAQAAASPGETPQADLKPTSVQAPGYPFLLAFSWRLLGDGPLAFAALSLLQALLVSTVVWPVSWLARRWYGEKAALWTAWIVGLYPAFLWAATRLHHYPLAVFFHPWVVAGWIHLRARPSARAAAAVGALTGVGALFQPLLLGVAGLLGAGSLWSALRARARTAVRSLLIAAALVALVILPWVVRGYRVHGRFVPLKDSFAKEFWIGNNPAATGTDCAEGGAPLINQLVLEHPELKSAASEAELMDRMQALALHEIRRDPGGFVTRSLRRVLWFWTLVPTRFLPAAGMLRHVVVFYAAGWLALAGLALATLRRRARRPPEYVLVLGVYLFVYSVVYGLTFVAHSRFRGEAEYVLIPAAACTLAGWLRGRGPAERERAPKT